MRNEILTTTNYELFKFYNKNRIVVKHRAQTLANAIKKLDLTREKPIVVNEKMEIIDGQHRYEACKLLGKPIYYIKTNVNGKMNDAIISLNANQAPWQVIDYVKNYASRGFDVYNLILECMEKYKCPIGFAVTAVTNSTGGTSAELKAGMLRKGRIAYSTTMDILEDFKKIFKDWNNTNFFRSLMALIKSGKYNHKTDFAKYERNRYSIVVCGNTEQYMKMHESILNNRRRGEKIRLV